RPRYHQAERLHRLEVDHELELRRLLDRKVTGPGALENPVDVNRDAPVEFYNHGAVSDQTSVPRDLAPLVHRRNAVRGRGLDDRHMLPIEAREGRDDDGIDARPAHGGERGVVSALIRNVAEDETGAMALHDLPHVLGQLDDAPACAWIEHGECPSL